MRELWVASGGETVPPSEHPLLTLGDPPVLRVDGVTVPALDVAATRRARSVALTVAEAHTAGDGARALGRTAPQVQEIAAAPTIYAATKIETYYAALRFMADGAALAASVERVDATRLVWLGSGGDHAYAVAARAGFSGSIAVAGAGPSAATRRERVLDALKRSRLDWTVRSLSTLPRALREPRFHAASRPVLAMFDVWNTGMIDNLALVASEIVANGMQVVCVTMEPRVAQRLASRAPHLQQRPLSSFMAPSRAIGAFTRAGSVTAEIRSLTTAACAAAGAADPVLAARIGRLFTTPYVAQSLVDLDAVGVAVDRLRPSAVITSSDAHRTSRMAVLQARARGVPTMVVQHGALVIEDIYLPVIADQMAAWGPWCRDWFTSRGVAEDRVFAAGYPRGLGGHRPVTSAGDPRGAQASRPSAGGDARPHPVTRLLFAMQPISQAVNDDLLGRLYQVLAADPVLRLTVRPHPGSTQRGAVAAMVAAAPPDVRARVSLSEAGTDLATDLAHSDVVLISDSTVGVDAINAGSPVMLLRHPAITEAIPYESFGAVVVAADAKQVAAGLERLTEAHERAALAERAEGFVAAYVGATGSTAAGAIAGRLAAVGDPG